MLTTLSARVLGQRIRQLRTRLGLTQQDLAGEDYSKSYISAIEQGKTRPSLEALQRMAARLEVPAGTLLDPDAPGFAPADFETMPRRVRRRRGVRAGAGGDGPFDPMQRDMQISQAEVFIYTGHPSQALDILRPFLSAENGGSNASGTADATGAYRPLSVSQLLRVYYLAASAAVQVDNVTEALEYAQNGLQLAGRMNDHDAQERLRLTLGTIYYQADQPISALEQHKQCLDAVDAGLVHDPNFKLRVLNQIASDYWALRDDERAVATYKMGLDLLNELSNMERQADLFWKVSTIRGEEKNYSAGMAAAVKALSLYEGLDNLQMVARMESRYGNILLDMGDTAAAEEYLERSLNLAESLNSEMDRAVALTNLARLSMKKGDLEGAQSRADEAVELARSVARRGEQKAKGKAAKGSSTIARSRGAATSVLAGCLALSGEIASQREDEQRADELFKEAINSLPASSEGSELGSDIYQRYAGVLAGRGQHEQASRYFEQAYRAVSRRTR